MNKELQSARALGKALRARFEVYEELPATMQVLLLRMAVREHSRLPVPHRVNA
jgi:hypothetical protein